MTAPANVEFGALTPPLGINYTSFALFRSPFPVESDST